MPLHNKASVKDSIEDEIHGACYDTANYLATRIAAMGPFEVIYNGERSSGIPATCWRLKDDADVGFNLYDLADRLRTRGWQVPAYSLPKDCDDVVIQRVLVRQGVSRDLSAMLMDDMQTAVDYFSRRPVRENLSAEEASGFHH